MDKQELEAAYAAVRQQETNLIAAIDEIAVDFLGKVTALVEAQPKGAENSMAGQFLGRVAAATMGVFGYDLSNMRKTYGLVEEPAPPESEAA